MSLITALNDHLDTLRAEGYFNLSENTSADPQSRYASIVSNFTEAVLLAELAGGSLYFKIHLPGAIVVDDSRFDLSLRYNVDPLRSAVRLCMIKATMNQQTRVYFITKKSPILSASFLLRDFACNTQRPDPSRTSRHKKRLPLNPFPSQKRVGKLYPLGALLCCFFLFLSPNTQGQGLIETMVAQLAKLEIMLQEAKQGYKIVQSGLNTINQIKHGDFDLHSAFFSGLMAVNPTIKNYAEVGDIIAMQVQILANTKKYLSQFNATGLFAPYELTYLGKVLSNLVTLTGTDVDELISIITDGDLQMSDDQRLSRIDLLYKKVESKYNFLRSFYGNVNVLAFQRQSTQLSLQNLSKLFQP